MERKFVVMAEGQLQCSGVLSRDDAYSCVRVLEQNGYTDIRVLEAIDTGRSVLIFDPELEG